MTRIARIAIECSGPTHLEQAHKTAEVLEEIARRLRIDCQLGSERKQVISEDGRFIGSIVYEDEDAVTG
jgi:transcriptional regulator